MKRIVFLILLLQFAVAYTPPTNFNKNIIKDPQNDKNIQKQVFSLFNRALEHIVVKLKPGVDANETAKMFGMELVGKVGTLPNSYIFKTINSLESNQQKRDEKMAVTISALQNTPEIEWAERDRMRYYQKRQDFSDPRYGNQWHLNGNGATDGANVNIEPVWARGINGEGVQICIVDDGLANTHPDLAPNYVAADSFDYNDRDQNPAPTLATDNHGTACAGVAAARDDGASCGVGAAFRARLAGVRAIAEPIAETLLAQAITHNMENNMIYSNSWGTPACQQDQQGRPVCDLVDMSSTMSSALLEGVTSGRDGKGAIYLFAAGNDRGLQSNVNYQDIARSIYVIPVAAYSNLGLVSPYSEPGSGLLIAAPSNGGTLAITTTDRQGAQGYDTTDCTNDFGGTSSATPLAAGIVALMLQQNSDLTWRDVQDILVNTAVQLDASDPGWQTNGAGFHVSHDYGFGGIDADAAVKEAKKRSNHLTCTDSESSDIQAENINIPDGNQQGITSTMKVSGIKKVIEIEHTLVTVSIAHPYRGDLAITLISPSGTQSILAEQRRDPGDNYQAWAFKTVFNWGEDPNGEWKLVVADLQAPDAGQLINWQLTFYGKCEGETSSTSKAAIAAAVIVPLIIVFAAIGIIGFMYYRYRNGKSWHPTKETFSKLFRKKGPAEAPQQANPSFSNIQSANPPAQSYSPPQTYSPPPQAYSPPPQQPVAPPKPAPPFIPAQAKPVQPQYIPSQPTQPPVKRAPPPPMARGPPPPTPSPNKNLPVPPSKPSPVGRPTVNLRGPPPATFTTVIHCSNCGREGPAGKFCIGCGNRL